MLPNAQLVPLPSRNHILLEDEPAWAIFTERLSQPGISGLVEVDATRGGASSDSPKEAQAFCPAGKTAIGGSYEITGGQEGSSPNRIANVAAQAVRRRSTSYEVEAYETGAGTDELWTVFVRVICAEVE